jgi:DNA-binding IclR family transcriptional regulator
VKSLSRALALLTELSKHDRPLTLTELSDSVGLHKSTVHRMLATLAEYGLVQRDEAKRYIVGLWALELAQAAQDQTGPNPLVVEALASLATDRGQATFYAVPQGPLLRCVASVPHDRGDGPTVSHEVSQPIPLHSTALGKAFIAYRAPSEIERYLATAPFRPATPFTITSADALRRALAAVRRRGYSTEDREHHPRRRRLGAPVLAPSGYAAAAVAVSLPRQATRGDLDRIVQALIACAASVEHGLFGASHPRTTMLRVAATA